MGFGYPPRSERFGAMGDWAGPLAGAGVAALRRAGRSFLEGLVCYNRAVGPGGRHWVRVSAPVEPLRSLWGLGNPPRRSGSSALRARAIFFFLLSVFCAARGFRIGTLELPHVKHTENHRRDVAAADARNRRGRGCKLQGAFFIICVAPSRRAVPSESLSTGPAYFCKRGGFCSVCQLF